MNFDGTDDYIGTGITSPPMETGDATYSMWAKITNTSSTGALFRQHGSHVCQYNTSGNNQFRVATWGDNTGDFGPSITDNKWHHYAFKRVGSNYYLYVDGAEYSATANSPDSSSQPLCIAGYSDGAYFPAAISDVRIYNRPLSSSEIQTLYEWGSADTANPPTDGVAYYKLDGDPNDTWNSNDGANNGATFTTDAIRKQSGDFIASENDYIDLGVLEVDTNPITVSAWVKETTTRAEDGDGTSHCIVGQGWGGDDEIILSDNGLWFFGFNDTNGNLQSVSTSESYTSGDWVHLIGVFTGTELQLYINGTLRATTSANVTRTDSTKSAGIGARYDGNAWNNNMNGKIDDVRIYDYALTPQEILELYRYGTKGINMNKHTVMQ